MKTTIQRQCPCGQAFDTEHDTQWPTLTREHCPPCYEQLLADEEQARQELAVRREAERIEAKAASYEAKVDSLTPERIRLTDISDKRFNAALWKKVEAWKPTAEKPWLGTVGDPGECKTRCAFMRLRQIARSHGQADESFTVAVVNGMSFAKLVTEQYDRSETSVMNRSTTIGAIASSDLRDLRFADVLLFDELGKVKSSPGVMDELFGLIDHRHSHNLVTLWTSNSHPEDFCKTWPQEYAGPGCGRIIESSTILRA